MIKKYYAVKIGLKPGIYETWDECKENVNGFPGAIYKSFKTLDEAKVFIGDENIESVNVSDYVDIKTSYMEMHMDGDVIDISVDSIIQDTPYAFVDGSYNIGTKVYGYGGFLVANGKKHFLTGNGNDEEMSQMRNVAGEVLGAQAAIKKAIELGLNEITIYYDYAGIEMWALGNWKRNKVGTIAYYDYVNSVRYNIAIYFVKVKGHSGIEGNEEADLLAKRAVGIE